MLCIKILSITLNIQFHNDWFSQLSLFLLEMNDEIFYMFTIESRKLQWESPKEVMCGSPFIKQLGGSHPTSYWAYLGSPKLTERRSKRIVENLVRQDGRE